MNATTKQKINDFYAAHKAGLDTLANYLGVPAIWLVCAFYNESGLNPLAKNSIGAVGLNQMMPATLAGLGVDPETFRTGGVEYQLQVMQQFFAPIKGKIKRAGDLYLFNFFPAAIINNYPMDFAIGKAGDTSKLYGLSRDLIYQQNKGLDYNGNGEITRSDFTEGFEAKYDELVKGNFFFPGPADRPKN